MNTIGKRASALKRQILGAITLGKKVEEINLEDLVNHLNELDSPGVNNFITQLHTGAAGAEPKLVKILEATHSKMKKDGSRKFRLSILKDHIKTLVQIIEDQKAAA